MRTVFHQQFDDLVALLGEMCRLAGTAIAASTHALPQADLALAEDVIDRHDRLVQLRKQAEDAAFKLPAAGAGGRRVASSDRLDAGRCRG